MHMQSMGSSRQSCRIDKEGGGQGRARLCSGSFPRAWRWLLPAAAAPTPSPAPTPAPASPHPQPTTLRRRRRRRRVTPTWPRLSSSRRSWVRGCPSGTRSTRPSAPTCRPLPAGLQARRTACGSCGVFWRAERSRAASSTGLLLPGGGSRGSCASPSPPLTRPPTPSLGAGANWVDPPKRERKRVASYAENEFYRMAMQARAPPWGAARSPPAAGRTLGCCVLPARHPRLAVARSSQASFPAPPASCARRFNCDPTPHRPARPPRPPPAEARVRPAQHRAQAAQDAGAAGLPVLQHRPPHAAVREGQRARGAQARAGTGERQAARPPPSCQPCLTLFARPWGKEQAASGLADCELAACTLPSPCTWPLPRRMCPQREAQMRQQGASDEAIAAELAPKEDDPQPLSEEELAGGRRWGGGGGCCAAVVAVRHTAVPRHAPGWWLGCRKVPCCTPLPPAIQLISPAPHSAARSFSLTPHLVH